MNENAGSSRAVSSMPRLPRRLRVIAVMLLAVGIAAAEVVYWRGTRLANSSDNPALLTNEKELARQSGILYGNQADVIQQWSDELAQPGAQAAVVVVVAALASGGCFYLARLLENDASRKQVNRSTDQAD